MNDVCAHTHCGETRGMRSELLGDVISELSELLVWGGEWGGKCRQERQRWEAPCSVCARRHSLCLPLRQGSGLAQAATLYGRVGFIFDEIISSVFCISS